MIICNPFQCKSNYFSKLLFYTSWFTPLFHFTLLVFSFCKSFTLKAPQDISFRQWAQVQQERKFTSSSALGSPKLLSNWKGAQPAKTGIIAPLLRMMDVLDGIPTLEKKPLLPMGRGKHNYSFWNGAGSPLALESTWICVLLLLKHPESLLLSISPKPQHSLSLMSQNSLIVELFYL